jgi:hypothetical protein
VLRSLRSKRLLILFFLLIANWVWSEVNYQHIDESGNINQVNIGGEGKRNIYSSHGSTDSPVQVYDKKLSEFNRLYIDIPAEIIYKKGSPRVRVRSQAHVYKAITVDVDKGLARIKSKSFSTNQAVVIEIFSQGLKKVAINGSADVTVQDINQKEFEINLLGAAYLYINGEAETCIVEAEGAIELDAKLLLCKVLKVNAGGSADLRILAKDTVKGKVEGAVDVEIFGKPQLRQLAVIGVADVTYE